MSVLIQYSILKQRDLLFAYERPAFTYVILFTFDRFEDTNERALQ